MTSLVEGNEDDKGDKSSGNHSPEDEDECVTYLQLNTGEQDKSSELVSYGDIWVSEIWVNSVDSLLVDCMLESSSRGRSGLVCLCLFSWGVWSGGVCSGGCLLPGFWSGGCLLPGGCLVWGVSAPRGLVRGVCSQGVSGLGGVCSRRSGEGGVCSWGECLLLDGVCSGGSGPGGVSQHALRQTPYSPHCGQNS